MKRRILKWFLLACLLLPLAACAPDPYAAISTELEITYTADGFTPLQWKVPSGQEITLTLANESDQDRSWIWMSQPVDLPLQGQDRSLIYFEAQAAANSTQTITFTAPNAPGEYDILCDPASRLEDGWVGKVVVYSSEYLSQLGTPEPNSK